MFELLCVYIYIYICVYMDEKISWLIRSEWKTFITIKDVFKAKLDKTLLANLFNSTVLPAVLYTSESRVTTMKKEQTGYNIEGYRKINAGNIYPHTLTHTHKYIHIYVVMEEPITPNSEFAQPY